MSEQLNVDRANRTAKKRKDACPRKGEHAPDVPADYVAYHEWAEQMAKTHTLTRCKGCRLFVIWVPKKKPRGASR